MNDYIKSLETDLFSIGNGFKTQEKKAIQDFKNNSKNDIKELAYLAYNSNIYQVRMYAVFLFGYLAKDSEILLFMRDVVSKEENWRVQEILAKSFDEFCKQVGYENSLLVIDDWLSNSNPNTR